jgi:hypothetical protein
VLIATPWLRAPVAEPPEQPEFQRGQRDHRHEDQHDRDCAHGSNLEPQLGDGQTAAECMTTPIPATAVLAHDLSAPAPTTGEPEST